MDLTDLVNSPPWEWPRNAREVIVRVLLGSGNSAADRTAAAGLAGELVVMDDSLAHLLLAIVRDANEAEELRARAAISLGPALEEADLDGYDDPCVDPSISVAVFQQIKETLQEVYLNSEAPKEVRRRALEASVRAEQDWHREAVLAAYSSGDDEWKLTAVFCMRYAPDCDARILEALESANPDIHMEAIRTAGECGLDAAWPHIAVLLDSAKTERPLLLAAIEAAPHTGGREASELLDELAVSEDEEIALAAEEALEEQDFSAGGEDEEEES